MKTIIFNIFHKEKKEIIKILFLSILFAALFFLSVYYIYEAVLLNYLPIFSDEYGYYLDAKAFELCNSPSAAFTINEQYSKIGNYSFHGFAYSIFYGLLFKLQSFLGIDPSIMIANIFLLILFFMILAVIKISTEKKLLIGIFFLSNFIYILYLSSSMTEILHYIFSFVLAYTIYLVYKNKENKYVYLLISLVLFLSVFRLTWIFVLFGLFPLINSFKTSLKYFLITLFGLLFVLAILHFTYAPFPFGFIHSLTGKIYSNTFPEILQMVYEHFISNLGKYFVYEKYENIRFVFYYKYLIVAALIYSIYESIRSRSKIIVAATIIFIVYFVSLLLIYDAFDWHEVRILIAPLIIMVVIWILSDRVIPVYIVIVFQLINLNAVLEHKEFDDRNREAMNARIEQSQVLLNNFMELKNYTSLFEKKDILILMDRKVISSVYSPLFYQLPLSINDKCTRYSFIFGKKFDIGKSKSDLLVSDREEKVKNVKLVGKNDYFYFYKIIH